MTQLGDLKRKISLKRSASPIFLVLNTFVWYLLTFVVFNIIVFEVSGNDPLGLLATYYLGIVVTAIIGSKLFSRRKTFLLIAWLLMGAVATGLLVGLTSSNMLTNFFIAALFGASIGLGLPACLSYFANLTSVENRGSVGGVTWSAVGVVVLIFAFFMSNIEPWESLIALTIWRLFGSIGFWILDIRVKTEANTKPVIQKAPSYFDLIRKKEILLYLFPWVMFSIINFAEAPILEKAFGSDLFAYVQLVEFAFIGVFAVLGGFVADLAGRKRVVIAGFVMLGIEYAAMSAFSIYPESVYLFLALDGVTWGLLFSVFFMTIWGDLGENQEKEKYYTLGGVPFLLAGFLSVLVKPYAQEIQTGTAFTLASFFLFVSVIPLMYAPETLPEKVMKDRDLKSYVEKAKKKLQKESENTQGTKDTPQPENDEKVAEIPPAENDGEYEKAEKLAEKYY